MVEKKVERFAPSVLVPGAGVVQPPGWMWVLAFALRGVPWAVAEALRPQFRERALRYYAEKKLSTLVAERDEAERRVRELNESVESQLEMVGGFAEEAPQEEEETCPQPQG